MTLPELVLRRPVATVTCVVAALVLGLVSLTRLPVAYLPEIEGRSLTVQATYRSSSPREIERTICRPLEEELASLTGLESLSSTATASGASCLRCRCSVRSKGRRQEDRQKRTRKLPTRRPRQNT